MVMYVDLQAPVPVIGTILAVLFSAFVFFSPSNKEEETSQKGSSDKALTNKQVKFRPRLVIFDKDGTLIDFDKQWASWLISLHKNLQEDSRLTCDISQPLFDRLGLDSKNNSIIPGSPVTATPMTKLKEYTRDIVQKHCGLDEQTSNSLVAERWVIPNPTSTSFPLADLKLLFSTLKNNDILIGINTTDDRHSTQATMDYLGLTPLIDIMFCGDDPLPVKPAPDSCLYICNTLGVSPEQAVMVGDTIYDLQMGKAAGFGLSVGVSNGSTPADKLLREADFVIPGVDSLYKIISLWLPSPAVSARNISVK